MNLATESSELSAEDIVKRETSLEIYMSIQNLVLQYIVTIGWSSFLSFKKNVILSFCQLIQNVSGTDQQLSCELHRQAPRVRQAPMGKPKIGCLFMLISTTLQTSGLFRQATYVRIHIAKKVRETSRECHNHKPQPFPDPKRKRKPTNPNVQSNKRTKSTKISFLFPKRGNRNTIRTEKHKNKMTHGKTHNKSPRRINHKATKSKTNTGTTALQRSVEQTTRAVKALLQLANFTLGPDATLNTEIHKNSVRIKAPNSVNASKRKHNKSN